MHRPSRPLAARVVRVAVPTLLLAACASSNASPPSQVSVRPTTVVIDAPSGTVEARTTGEDRAETRTIDAKPDVAWAKLPAVYGELELPVNTYVDATRQIAAKGVRVRGHIGKLRVASIVTCGSDVTGDDKANGYEVTLDVGSTVAPAPNGQTHVMTMVMASARPMSTSGEAVRCASTGALERRIATALAIKAATP